MERPYRIHLLGTLEVHTPHQIIAEFRTRKGAALVAYLAYYLNRSHPREALIEMLWPESEPSAGRQNLRVELSALRRQIERDGAVRGSLLLTTHTAVQLQPAAFWTDVLEMEEALSAAQRASDALEQLSHLQRAAELYRGDLLPGFYEEWIVRERDRLADLHLSTLRRLARLLHEMGEDEAAIAQAHRAVAMNPLCEPSQFDLIRLYGAAGRIEDALRRYREFERLLRAELDVEPSEEMQSFVRGQLRGVSAPSPRIRSPRLPTTLSRYFGRTEDIARLVRSLTTAGNRGPGIDSRLITLTGPGGCGKTRLALEVAYRLRHEYHDAVWFVPLDHLSDGARLVDVVARSLGLPWLQETHPWDQIVTALAGRHSLLVLDTFEHVVEKGRAIVERLLAEAPTLACLVTSQTRLGLAGEQEIPLSPLPVPDPRCAATPEKLAVCASAQLFADRAQLVRPDFRITASNAGAVAEICARLEGHALALELAAGWAKALSPAQIAERLDDRFALLVTCDRPTSARHASLSAVMDWSWRLMPPPAQDFLRRLSIFRGGWDVEAAASVCEQPRAMELITTLCDRSLVAADELGDNMRYRLLETVREYAAGQTAPDVRSALAARHAAYYLSLAERAERGLLGPNYASWVERLRAETANLAGALEFAEHTEAGLKAGAALATFWQVVGALSEAASRLDRLLARNADAPVELRAKALVGAAAIAVLAGDRVAAASQAQDALALCAHVRDPAVWAEIALPLANPNLLLYGAGSSHAIPGLARLLELGRSDPHVAALLLGLQGEQALLRGDHAAAQAALAECEALYRRSSDLRGVAALLCLRAKELSTRGEYRQALRLYEESLVYYGEVGDEVGVATALNGSAYFSIQLSHYDRAEAYLARYIDVAQRIGAHGDISIGLWMRGGLALRRGQYDLAARDLRASVAAHRAGGNPAGVADALIPLAAVAAAQGDLDEARALLEECLALRRSGTDRQDIAFALCELAFVEIRDRNLDRAEAMLRESLTIAEEVQSAAAIAHAEHGLGLAAQARGDMETAMEWLGRSAARRARMADRKRAADSLAALIEAAILRGCMGRAERLFDTLQYVAAGLPAEGDLPDKMEQLRLHLGNARRAEPPAGIPMDWTRVVLSALAE